MIGNREAVARKHYLQVTDGHLERARSGWLGSGGLSGAADARGELQAVAGRNASARKSPGFAGAGDKLRLLAVTNKYHYGAEFIF
ncbi:MAG TPA: hypothetical protein VIK18_17130 [Pirellulales bacterium]